MISEIQIRTTSGTLHVTKDGAMLDGMPVRITGAAPHAENVKRCSVFCDGWNGDAPTRQVETALAILADGKNGDVEAGRVLARLIRIGVG